MNYPPTVGKRKVYIIDEAHELTTHALNALLKTLEEPPENVMFILATTDPQQLIQTILSRCLRLDFHRISEVELKKHMANICAKKNIEITDEALNLLTSNADGSARDALSLLDQCLSGDDTKLDRDTVLDYLGTVSDDFFIKITDSIYRKNAAEALLMLDSVLKDGKDVKQIMSNWMGHYRSLLIGKYIPAPEDILNMSGENVRKLQDQAKAMPLEDINRGIITLAETINNARYSPQPRILMELAIVNLATAGGLTSGTEQKVKPKSIPEMPKKESGSATDSAMNKQEHSNKNNTVLDGTVEKAPIEAVYKSRDEGVDEVPVEVFFEAGNEFAIETLKETEKDTANKASMEIANADWVDTQNEIPKGTKNETANGTSIKTSGDKAPISNMDDLSEVWAGKLDRISDKDFVLVMNNSISLNIAEKNRQSLEDAVERIVGKRLKMVLKEADKNSNSAIGRQQSLFIDRDEINREGDNIWDEVSAADIENGEELSDEDLKREIEDKFNINLRIEE